MEPPVWTPPRLVPDEVRAVEFGPPHERSVLAVQTCPRPSGPTLWSTLRSLMRAGTWLGPRLLVVDGGHRPKLRGWDVASTKGGVGSSRTFSFLLREVVARWPEVEVLIYLQDDVECCAGALDYIRRVKVPTDAALVSYFCETWPERPLDRPALGILEALRCFDAQCQTLPRRTIDALLRLDLDAWESRHGCDLMLGRSIRCGNGAGIADRFAIHAPSLVQHAGSLNSACGHSHLGERRSPSFPGSDFDARRWLP
jgi:hypothetical protein